MKCPECENEKEFDVNVTGLYSYNVTIDDDDGRMEVSADPEPLGVHDKSKTLEVRCLDCLHNDKPEAFGFVEPNIDNSYTVDDRGGWGERRK